MGRILSASLASSFLLRGRECPPRRSPSLNRAPGAPASPPDPSSPAPSPWALWPAWGFAAVWEVSPPRRSGGPGVGNSPPLNRERNPASHSEQLGFEGWWWCSFVFSKPPSLSACLSVCFLTAGGPSGVGSRDEQWDLKSHGWCRILKNTESFCCNLRILRFCNPRILASLPRER